ncbi:MAG TPA: pyridoxal-phosphate dependent enzyme, partial [Cellvibrionaceae bacterium]|nr:pyridoxal-phosphate dependent enzyme [Cellvibrionaceae bacterium]
CAARGVISFGGAYSNHLYALARVAKALNLPAVAIIRAGDADLNNPTLSELRAQGMQLLPISREQYRRKMEPAFSAELTTRYADFYLIPEGGAGVLGAQGFADYAEAVSAQLRAQDITPDSVWLPAGTGTSVAGLASRWHNVQAVGALAITDPKPYTQAVEAWTQQLTGSAGVHRVNWHGFDRPFGKIPASILDVCREFWCETGVLFDPIYGGKVLLALQKAFAQGLRNQQILILHTGGNQGWRGVLNRPQADAHLQDALNQYFQDTASFMLHDADLTLGIAANAVN